MRDRIARLRVGLQSVARYELQEDPIGFKYHLIEWVAAKKIELERFLKAARVEARRKGRKKRDS